MCDARANGKLPELTFSVHADDKVGQQLYYTDINLPLIITPYLSVLAFLLFRTAGVVRHFLPSQLLLLLSSSSTVCCRSDHKSDNGNKNLPLLS